MSYVSAPFVIVLSCGLGVASISSRATDQSERDSVASRPPAWATLVGSTERNKYHRITCGVAKKIRPENALWFVDANDATENGYVRASCNDRRCQAPLPDPSVQPGKIGGPGLPPPDLNPPEIPRAATPGPKTARSKANAANREPPRFPPIRVSTAMKAAAAQEMWKAVMPYQELEARRKWDVWAEWALDRWCERWHVSASGRINSDTAYFEETELELLAQLKLMKEQIQENKKRIHELKTQLEGKKKASQNAS